MESARSEQSLANLVRDLRDETTTLIRQEVALAKAEMGEKVSRLSKNAAYIGVGAALGLAALLLLLFAIRELILVGFVNAGVSPGLAMWLSFFIVALLAGIVGWILIAKGKKALAEEGVVPRKTVESLRVDQYWLKQKMAHT